MVYLIHFTLTPHEPYLIIGQFHLIKSGLDTSQQILFEYLHRILLIYLANLIYLVVEVFIPLYAHWHILIAHRGIILPRNNDHSSTRNYQSRMIFDLWQPLFSANDWWRYHYLLLKERIIPQQSRIWRKTNRKNITWCYLTTNRIILL